MKYIHQSPNTRQIVKSLMFCFEMVLKNDPSHHPPLSSSDVTETEINDQWEQLFLCFICTVKYWEGHHILYFIESGWSFIILNTFADSFKIECVSDMNDVAKSHQFLYLGLYTKIVQRIKKIGKKDRTLYKLFHQEIKNVGNDVFHKNIDFHGTAKLFIKDPVINHMLEPIIYCGYPFCNKAKAEFAKKNKCERCKLIRYCSRKHQKKHWKMIHSQQCKQY